MEIANSIAEPDMSATLPITTTVLHLGCRSERPKELVLSEVEGSEESHCSGGNCCHTTGFFVAALLRMTSAVVVLSLVN
jgi:hypothetical protein